jgi:hypothetical protein
MVGLAAAARHRRGQLAVVVQELTVALHLMALRVQDPSPPLEEMEPQQLLSFLLFLYFKKTCPVAVAVVVFQQTPGLVVVMGAL